MDNVYGIYLEEEFYDYDDRMIKSENILIGVVQSEEEAVKYVEKYENRHVYHISRGEPEVTGMLRFRKIDILTISDHPKWLGERLASRFDTKNKFYNEWVVDHSITPDDADRILSDPDDPNYQNIHKRIDSVKYDGKEIDYNVTIWINKAKWVAITPYIGSKEGEDNDK